MSTKFKDAVGREWELRLFLPDIPELKELGLDLNKARKDSTAFDVLNDVETFGRVMGHLCEEQIKSKTLTYEQFAQGFDGPTCFAAIDALMEAWIVFYQRPTIAKAAIERMAGAIAKVEAETIELIQKDHAPQG